MSNKKIVVVTGGSLSSLGKGVVASSVGALIASTGKTVALQKFDPYLNVDSGTMNPGEHGECFVLDDGLECDLDLGNYERFLGKSLDKRSSVTTGMVLQTVLQNERDGKYAGKTVQIIPHVTDEICNRFESLSTDNDVTVIEFGGTVGDIEGASLFEAARIFKAKPEVDLLHVHVVYVPYLETSKEFKTKLAQRSIRDTMGLGFAPDIIVCRSDEPVDDSVKSKVALAAGLNISKIFNGWNVKDVYEVPLMFNDQKLGEQVLDYLGLTGKIDVSFWEKYRLNRISPRKVKEIAICGKYVEAPDAYKSVIEAIKHASVHVGIKPKITLFDIEAHGQKEILNYDAVIIPGGFGERGWADKTQIAKQCFDEKIPMLGICLGMQAMAVAYARHECGITKANSTEFRKDCEPIIDIMEEQKTKTEFGGTLRVGSYEAKLLENSLVAELYENNIACERHRHRYELQVETMKKLDGLIASGVSPDNQLVEFIEYPGQFWVGCQGHPELKTSPFNPAPLFVGLLNAC